jgi:hypothetical protein
MFPPQRENTAIMEETLDKGLVYSAKGRIFNNMLYVRYVHLTKGQTYS